MSSLQRQLRRSNLVALLVAMIALLWLANLGVNRLAVEYIVSRLQHDAESIIAALEKNAEGGWQLDESRVGSVYHRVRSGHYYHLVGNEVEMASRSLWDCEITPEHLAPGQTEQRIMPGVGNETWLTWRQGFEKGGDNFTLWIAEDIQPLQQAKLRYSLLAVGLLVGTLTLLLMVQQWLLKRGFRRLDTVRAAIADLREGNEHAMDISLPDEVKPLADEIDRLLEQLQRRVTRSRHALGNLAHELKRPLQRLKMVTEPLDKSRQHELVGVLDEIQWLIERELKRARIVGVSSPGRHTVLAEEIPELIGVFRRIHPGVTLTSSYSDALVLPHDRDDILELLGNLVDNACQYGNGEVELAIREGEDDWILEVADNGPGIPEARLEQITKRGVRLDETGTGGGLGLAICRDIVDTYGGTLDFDTAPAGGLRVRVCLPKGRHTTSLINIEKVQS